MAKKPSSDYDPFKTDNPLLALSAIGLHTATYLTDVWLGAMRGMVDSAKELERRADEELAENETTSDDVAKMGAPDDRVVAEDVRARKSVQASDEAEPLVKSKASNRSQRTVKRTARKSVAKATAKLVQAKVDVPADDLKMISGVGPKLEQFLNRRGIVSYAQVAALTKKDIETLNRELNLSGRIDRDDWLGQAKALLSKGAA